MRRKDKERDAAFAWQVMAEAPYATLSLVDGEAGPTPFRCPREPVRRKLHLHPLALWRGKSMKYSKTDARR